MDGQRQQPLKSTSTTDTNMEGISSSNKSGIGKSQMNFANGHDDPIGLGGALPRRRFNTSGGHESTEELLPIANSMNESTVGIDPLVNSMNESTDEISALVDSFDSMDESTDEISALVDSFVSMDESTDESSDESTDEISELVDSFVCMDEPADESSDESTDESSDESTDESSDESTDESITLVDSMNESRAASVSQLRCGNPPTIYRVPESIRQLSRYSYEPCILAIGPYHHGHTDVKDMEVHKWQYLDLLLSRNPGYSLESYISEIRKLEDEARSCYSDDVDYNSNKFVKMMVLDGCFIVELFLRLKEQPSEVDPVFSASWMLIPIGYDLLLLENQIPFIVLQRIFEMAILEYKPFEFSFVELAFDFFFNFFHEIMPSAYNFQMMDSITPPHHLLDLFHWYLIPTQTRNNQSNLPCNPTVESKKPFFLSKVFHAIPQSNSAQLPISNNQSPPLPPPSTPRVTLKMIPCVTELQLAGVKFEKKVEWSSILDVKFSNGVLEIPPLSINSYTKGLFGNLLMFEQCYPKARICFTTYITFMHSIINTSEDVALLHQNGIINHLMGSDREVAHLFNMLGNRIFDFQNNYLSDLYNDVEKHCKTKWNMRWASLRRNYFTSPWAGLATLAAVIVILATIIQMIFTILSYK